MRRYLGGFLGMLLALAPAWGYVYSSHQSIWSPGPIPMQIKLGTGSTLSDGTNFSTSVQAAMQTWNGLLGTVQFSPQIVAPGAQTDNVNDVYFDSTVEGDPFGSGVLAVTLIFTSSSIFSITESDIIFNNAYSWDSYRGNLQTSEEIRRVALHELGHCLGLTHPDQNGQSVTALMNSTVSDLDALAADDIAGAQNVYRAPGQTAVPANDNFGNASTISLSSGSTQVAGSTVYATKEGGEPNHAGDAGGHSAWWRWTAPSNGSITINTQGSKFDTLLGVYTGGSVGSLVAVASNDEADANSSYSAVGFTASSGTTYSIAVDGWNAESGPVTLNLSFSPTGTPPFVISHPQDMTVAQGSVASFTSTGGGDPSPAGNWQVSTNGGTSWQTMTNTPPYGGVASDTLAIAFANYTMSGYQYRRVFTNSGGTAASNAAVLTVQSPPIVPGGGGTLNLFVGEIANFSIGVGGTPPFSYQWQRNGVNIPGATSSTYSLANVQLADEGSTFRVVVTNTLGSTTSAPTTLHVAVETLLAITVQPQSQTTYIGTDLALSVTAVASRPISYQWSKNGSVIVGATSPTLVITNVQPGNAGDYSVFISTATQSVTSAIATVAVMSNPSVVNTASGLGHTLILANNGTVWGMGTNAFGELGLGSSSGPVVPALIMSDVVAIEAGRTHSFFIKSDFTLWATGFSLYGQLGDGSNSQRRTTPVQVATDVMQAAGGGEFSLHVKRDLTLWATGANSDGQLGLGDTVARNTWTQVASNVVWAAAGRTHGFFIKVDGTLWAMGDNANGQLGDGTTTRRLTPVQVASGVAKVFANSNLCTFYIKTDGTLWGMGANWQGELGDGSVLQRNSPVLIASDVVSAAVGDGHALFIKSDGTLWAMGNNDYGQLGLDNAGSKLLPTFVASNVAAVSAGGRFTAFAGKNGSYWGMGENGSSHPLGLPVGTYRTPTRILNEFLPGAPAAPASLVASDATSPASIQLRWQPVPGVLGYEVWRGTTSSILSAIRIAANVQVPFYQDNSVAADTTYFYWIRSVTGAGPSNSASPSDSGIAGTPMPPYITVHPASSALDAGGNASFSVVAGGVPLPGYQWEVKPLGSPDWATLASGGLYAGVNTSTLVVNQVLPDLNWYQFRCVVTNFAGSVTSDSAILTVNVPLPVIRLNPSSQSLLVGRPAVFVSVADSPVPLSYQWRKDGSDIPGATENSFSIASIAPGDAGSYSVVITNGAGSVTSQSAILSVEPAYGAVSVGAGIGQGFFIKADGSLWGAGYTNQGQLGFVNDLEIFTPGAPPPGVGIPIKIATGVAQVTGGSAHTVFLKTDGTVWTMGANQAGQLGDGTTTLRGPPMQVATGAVAVAAGAYHSLFLRADGTLWGAGSNSSGQLGDGTTAAHALPIQIASGVVAMDAAESQTFFIRKDGTLWAVGNNDYGQLGDGTRNVSRLVPVQVAANVVSVAAGDSFTLFIKADGSLWGMGLNSWGQLGTGVPLNQYQQTPLQISTGVEVAAAGYGHSVFLKADGTLWAMGRNSSGQLGIPGNTSDQANPTQLATAVSGLAVAGSHTFYIKSDGSLWGVGANTNGQLGATPSADVVTNPRLVIQGSNPVPNAPGAVAVTLNDLTGGTQLTWGLTLGAAKYEVWRNTTGDTSTATRIARGLSSPIFCDWSAALGTTYFYWIKAGNAGGTSGFSLPVSISVTVPPPTLSVQPSDRSVMAGSTAGFTVQATSVSPLSYQWQVSRVGEVIWSAVTDGATYSGAQTAGLTVVGSGLANSGDRYRCVVVNAGGSVTSNVATLTVTRAPGDFDNDGAADSGWSSPATGQRAVWFMSGTGFSGGVDLGAANPAVQIATTGDFNGDGKPDFVMQNKVTGERSLWLMNGTTQGSSVSLTTQVLDWQIVFTGDINGDGKTDLVWQNMDTGQALVWYMNGSTRTTVADLGITDAALQVVGAADFNADGKPDFLVQHRRTGARAIWLMNGTTRIGTLDLGNQTLDWELGPAADFNGDGKPDLIWQNTQTGLRMVWIMNGGNLVSAQSLGTFPTTWKIVSATDLNNDGQPDLVWQDKSVPAVDFNGDGWSDLVWQNPATGGLGLWFMNDLNQVGAPDLGTQALEWQVAGAADFNGDGKGDILWQNTTTGLGVIWLMNGTNLGSVTSLGTQALEWRIGGAADFNGDGQVDLVWQNTRTGQRSLWYMNGPNLGSASDLGFQELSWQIVGAGDFNGDGLAEIIWQNSASGQCTLWFMNGRQLGSAVDLGIVDLAWRIAGAADMDGDGQADIILQNAQTGARQVWIMHGYNRAATIALPSRPLPWMIVN